MAQPVIQASFNSGEWAPSLYARVDVQKFHSGAALLRNFFVDYRGGASTRSGTKYCLRGYKDSTAIRLIPFQASFTVSYMLEFGDGYIRFYNNGAPVLESALAITGATKANPCVVSVVNSYSSVADNDWVYITGVVGMTQLNGKYFKVHARSGGTITLYDLFGNPVDSSAFGTYVSGGTVQRVYTLPSPYQAADLALLKFAQNITTMVICHPSYAPSILSIISAANWTLTAISFGATVTAPTGIASSTTLAAGSYDYAYVVTAVDPNGQEGPPTSPTTLANLAYINTAQGVNTITWNAVAGAASYNVYKANPIFGAAVVSGAPYGFIGNTTGNSFADSYPGIAPDYTQTPPVVRNPFVGAGVAALTLTGNANYTTVPGVTIAAPSSGGLQASAHASLAVTAVAVVTTPSNVAVGTIISLGNGVFVSVATVDGIGNILTVNIVSGGSIVSGSTPANPVTGLVPPTNSPATFNLTWQIGALVLDSPGTGYTAAPAVTFSAGAATATATLQSASAGNPSVPAFFQQRLVLAAPTGSPQTLYMSQTGDYYNFNISIPSQADDAITATINSGQLSNIKAMVAQPSGLLTFADGAYWLINGGGPGAPVSPSAIVANPQSYVGVNDMPPIVSNYDLLTVQSKGSSVRDATYNFYANVFTGADISVLASHLFFGYKLTEWAWAEEPYKVVWAIRNDGTLLSLTFLKEQEFTAWSHSDTNGLFKSIATIVEPATQGYANAVYTVVQRTINAQTVQYVERFAERLFTNGATDAWTVDAGLQYSGAPATSFTGGEHLAGMTCTGLADGVVIPAFVMPATGNFILGTAASKVTIGLAFTAQLQTLPIDVGNPTIQSKMKKISVVTVRVAETLGLKIGTDFTNLVTMKDLVVGNVGANTNAVVTGLVTGDAMTALDPKWQEIGQFCIQQDQPFPATILGVMPELTVGDTAK